MYYKNVRLIFSALLISATMPSLAVAQMLDAPVPNPPAPVIVQPEPFRPAPVALEAAPEITTPPIVNAKPDPNALAPVPATTKNPFRDALVAVYDHHPALKAQREALEAVDESVSQAISGFRPTIEGGYGYGRQRSKNATATDWTYKDNWSKTLDVQQPIFSGGESWANYKSARDRVKAERAVLKDTEQQLLYNAVLAYSDVVEKKSVLKLNQNNVDVLRKQLEATQARFDVGEITRTDTAQSEARLSQSLSDERLALGALETSLATFKRAIGYDAPEINTMPEVPLEILPKSMDEAIAWAQTLNPALETAKFRAKAADSDIDARVGNILPEVTVNGAMSRSDTGNIPGVSRFDRDSLTLNVSIPLYQSGAEWSRVREARNLADQAKFNTLDVQNIVVEDVTRAWQDYNTATAVIASTNEAMKAAEVALEGVRQENQYGVRTILDVLDAEQELFTTRVNLARAERTEKVQAYRLLATVGKLTAQDLGLPVSYHDPKEHYDNVKYQLIGF
jgi:outer membrane protein